MLINTPEKWCDDSHAFAKDADGNAVWWKDPNAVQFDMQGALHHAYVPEELRVIYEKIYGTIEMKEGKGLPWVSKNWGREKVYQFLVKYDI